MTPYKICFCSLLAASLFFLGCREEEQTAAPPILPSASQKTLPSTPPDSISTTTTARKKKSSSVERVEILPADPAVIIQTPPQDTTLSHISKPADSPTKVFSVREGLLASIGTPSSVSEQFNRPPVHPDSQTWQDMVGNVSLGIAEETPDWIKVLGMAGQISGILAVLYFLFVD